MAIQSKDTDHMSKVSIPNIVNLIGHASSQCQNVYTMCHECCGHAWSWCRAFTKIERALVILELFLIIIFLIFLLFLILHFVACGEKPKQNNHNRMTTLYTTVSYDKELVNISTSFKYSTSTSESTESLNGSTNHKEYDVPGNSKRYTMDQTDDEPLSISESSTITSIPTKDITFIPTEENTKKPTKKNVKCTWKPSLITNAGSVYYLNDSVGSHRQSATYPAGFGNIANIKMEIGFLFILAKVESHNNTKLVCMLTAISKYWLITAASCIEEIEQKYPLRDYDIVKVFEQSRTSVAAVALHPRRRWPAQDVAAVRSGAALATPGVSLASRMDYLLLTVGEKLTVLTYTQFRHVGSEVSRKSRLHARPVYSLPRRLCAPARRARHLRPAGQRARGPVCAGPLSRPAPGPCSGPCAGAPALLRGALLAVSTRRCDRSCAPDVFASIPSVTFWLDRVIRY